VSRKPARLATRWEDRNSASDRTSAAARRADAPALRQRGYRAASRRRRLGSQRTLPGAGRSVGRSTCTTTGKSRRPCSHVELTHREPDVRAGLNRVQTSGWAGHPLPSRPSAVRGAPHRPPCTRNWPAGSWWPRPQSGTASPV